MQKDIKPIGDDKRKNPLVNQHPEDSKYRAVWKFYKKKRKKIMIKYYHEKEKATQITVNLEGDVQKYALSFLCIFNNAREYPNMFYKVENLCGSNKVFVTCRTEDAESIKEFLEQFGEITYTEEINRIVIKAEYDMKGYDEFFGDDCEVEFSVDIE